MKIKRVCKECGAEFRVDPYEIKRGRGKFCSKKCSDEARKKKIKRICKWCGKEFEVKPSKIKRGKGKFCSQKCYVGWQSENRSGENNPNWQGGLSFEPYCTKFNFAFKEYIRDKFGRVCFLCNKAEAEVGEKLSVHHVNYNKGCGCDTDETCQFVPLCRSCNAKVNGNRKEWEAKIKSIMKNKLNGWYV